MSRAERIRAAYHALAAQTGSYLTARALVMQRFNLSAAQADRLLGVR